MRKQVPDVRATLVNSHFW